MANSDASGSGIGPRRIPDLHFSQEQMDRLFHVVLGIAPTSLVFTDDQLIDKPGIMISRLNDEQVCALGRVVIPMVSSGFSKSGAAAIFTLAYHLKAPRTRFTELMFSDADPLNKPSADERYTDYSDPPLVSAGNEVNISPTNNPAKEAAVYAYIAASILRLFTKPPSTYTRAWDSIVQGFRRFYGEPVGVVLPSPSEAAMETLHNLYGIHKKMRITLYRFLYISNSKAGHEDLKRFLYDLHLSYTGLHAVSILFELQQALNCDVKLILEGIKSHEWRRQLDCLAEVVKLSTDAEGTHKLKMWRYGRIFDETFMAHLQTRRCPKLVYLLGSALQEASPETHKGILLIAQLKDVNEETKKKCKAAGSMLLQMIREGEK